MEKMRVLTKTILLGALVLAVFTDLALAWDIIQFHLRSKHETTIPMSIAVPFFGFPLYLGIIVFVWKITSTRDQYRFIFRLTAISPYIVALLGALTA
jgi:hypothetical protein